MKEVKGIGFDIPSEDEDFINIDSFSSLADTDIAVFSPDLSTADYSTYDSNSFHSSGKYEGKMLYNEESSASIKEHSKHWKRELLHFVETGRTLFIILPPKTDFFIYSGKKDMSGTGRNQKPTNYVSPFSNYEFLPFSFIEFHSATGKSVIPKSDLIKEFFSHFKDLITYAVYLKSQKDLNVIFTTKNGDRVLGTALKIEDGYVVFLPDFGFNDSKFTEYEEETGEEYWTDEAIRLGKILTNSLIAIDKVLKSEKVKTPKPEWTELDEYNLNKSNETKKLIKKIEREIKKKNTELIELSKVLEEQESLKDLLYETGKSLELSVIKGLRILGYSAENFNDGELELDQIIFSPEGYRYIGECEGKDNKDIDVSKFRQLFDGLNADFEKEDVVEKAIGLLFGNPQRLISPLERTLDFTLKCKTGAKREKIGLIKTADLYKVCKLVMEKNDLEFAKKCREAIHNQLGEVIKFPEYE